MFVDKQVKEKRYASSSEYIRQMLREKELFFAEEDLREKLRYAKTTKLVEVGPDFFKKKYKL